MVCNAKFMICSSKVNAKKITTEAMSEITQETLQSSELMRKSLTRLSVFFVLFVLTLGFEMLSNLIVFGFLAISSYRFKFHRGLLNTTIFLCFLFVIFFIMTENSTYIKYWTYTLRMLVLISFFNYLYREKLKKLELRPIIDKIFYLHIFGIIICHLSPSINNIVTNIFAFSVRGTNARVSGFFSGFDIISFFIIVYLAYEYLASQYVLTTSLIIKLLLGAFAIFQSGRFGIIPLAIFVLFLFVKLKNVKWFLLAFPVVLVTLSTGVLDSRIDNVMSTIKMLQVAVDDVEQVDNSFFEGKNIEGQYNLSPLTWYFEFISPFKFLGDFLFPGKLYIVDSGPAYFVLNFGLFIAVLLYVLYFRIFTQMTKRRIPYIVIVIFLAVDLKFRLLFALMPLVWLALNHFSYMQQLEKFKPRSA